MVAQEAEVIMAEDTPSPLNGELSQGSSDNSNKRKSSSGRMSKVRGILSGKSWRDKRKMKQAKNGAANDTASKHSGDEESTTYGVDVDENSKSAAALAATKKLLSSDNDDDHEETDLFNENEVAGKKYLLKIVLLLMDNKSRRFELLQLEFDSVKASVSDVLAQIPIAVTEACLQEQSYMGITCCDGVEKSPQDLLAGFCKGGDVMVAIAQRMTAAECVKLALPILGDSKVMTMLRSSGIDSSPWKEAKKKARSDARREKEQQRAAKTSTTKSRSKIAPESAPSKPRAVFAGSNVTKIETKARGNSSPQQASKKNTLSKAAPVITFHPNNDTPHPITPGGSIHVSEVHSTYSGKQTSSIAKVLIGIAILSLLGGLIKAADMYLSSPIQVGQVLSPGTVLHKCGIAGFVPGLQSALSAISSVFDCENSYLVVGDEVVKGYDKDGKVAWAIMGTHHSNQRYCDVNNKEMCKRGLHYLDNKHLIMSGTKITWIETFQKDVSVHPWPFEEKPLTRTWRKKN